MVWHQVLEGRRVAQGETLESLERIPSKAETRMSVTPFHCPTGENFGEKCKVFWKLLETYRLEILKEKHIKQPPRMWTCPETSEFEIILQIETKVGNREVTAHGFLLCVTPDPDRTAF